LSAANLHKFDHRSFFVLRLCHVFLRWPPPFLPPPFLLHPFLLLKALLLLVRTCIVALLLWLFCCGYFDVLLWLYVWDCGAAPTTPVQASYYTSSVTGAPKRKRGPARQRLAPIPFDIDLPYPLEVAPAAVSLRLLSIARKLSAT
jgi:hypothetical protein